MSGLDAWLTPQLLEVTTDVLMHGTVDPLHILHTHFATTVAGHNRPRCGNCSEALEVYALLCTGQQQCEARHTPSDIIDEREALYDRLVTLLMQQPCNVPCNCLIPVSFLRQAWSQELHALSLPSECSARLLLWGVLYALHCGVAYITNRYTPEIHVERSSPNALVTEMMQDDDDADACVERCLNYLWQHCDAGTHTSRSNNGTGKAVKSRHRVQHGANTAMVVKPQCSEAEKRLCEWVDTRVITLTTSTANHVYDQGSLFQGYENGVVRCVLSHSVLALRSLRHVALPLATLLSAHGVPGDFTVAFQHAWCTRLQRLLELDDATGNAVSQQQGDDNEKGLNGAYDVLCQRLADELCCSSCLSVPLPQSHTLLQADTPHTIAELWQCVLWWIAQLVEHYTIL